MKPRPSSEELARRMFAAYNEHGPNPWKAHNGAPVPPWEACGEQVRAKWTAAAAEALKVLA